MSFYPLIDDEQQMKELDRWLVSTILNTLRKRKSLLDGFHYPTGFFPFYLTGDNIIDQCKTAGSRRGMFQIPSFLRIYLALQIGVRNLGIDRVMHAESSYYESY